MQKAEKEYRLHCKRDDPHRGMDERKLDHIRLPLWLFSHKIRRQCAGGTFAQREYHILKNPSRLYLRNFIQSRQIQAG